VGRYNEIIMDNCPSLKVQFKHGMRWQYQYRIGDRIKWDHLRRPAEAEGTVVVPGISARANSQVDRYFAVVLVDDVIKSVDEISEHEYERLEAERIAAEDAASGRTR